MRIEAQILEKHGITESDLTGFGLQQIEALQKILTKHTRESLLKASRHELEKIYRGCGPVFSSKLKAKGWWLDVESQSGLSQRARTALAYHDIPATKEDVRKAIETGEFHNGCRNVGELSWKEICTWAQTSLTGQ